MKSPSFTLIAVGNMWSLIKNIFSVEIAFISWANFSWPSTHQSFFGKGNSSLWVSKCQATEQKEREGEGEKQLHACCRAFARKALEGFLFPRALPIWCTLGWRDRERVTHGPHGQRGPALRAREAHREPLRRQLARLTHCQHQKLAGYFCLGRCTFCCKGLFSSRLPRSQVMLSTGVQQDFHSLYYGASP